MYVGIRGCLLFAKSGFIFDDFLLRLVVDEVKLDQVPSCEVSSAENFDPLIFFLF
jgi:hypothetical protein